MSAIHWFITYEPGRCWGRCSDGRTFSNPTKNGAAFAHGMIQAFTLAGVSCELRHNEEGENENR